MSVRAEAAIRVFTTRAAKVFGATLPAAAMRRLGR